MTNTDKPKNKKLKYIGAAVAIALVGAGSFAWITSQDKAVNHFQGGEASGQDLIVTENFKPPTDWIPGGEVVKEVGITNIGKYNQFVRVSLDEALTLLKDSSGSFVKPENNTFKVSGDTVLFGINKENVVKNFSNQATFKTPDGKAVTLDLNGSTSELQAFYKQSDLTEKDPATGQSHNGYSYVLAFIDPNDSDKLYPVKLDMGSDDSLLNMDIKVDGGSFIIEDSKLNTNLGDYMSMKQLKMEYGETITAKWDTNVDKDGWFASTIKLKDKDFAPFEINFTNVTNGEWKYSDGYFYYTKVLKPGETTPYLFTHVKMSDKVNDELTYAKYDLTVTADGIQPMGAAVKDEWKPSSDIQSIYDGLETSK